jgi:small subunit ribosomal protein S8
MWSDPVADMLTRIRNGLRVRRRHVQMPGSKLKAGIARVLKDEGYIHDYDVIADDKQGILRIALKYGPEGEQVIQSIQRLSKAGGRYYRGVADLPQVLNGLGIAIVSTSRGVLSNRECRRQNVGGEVLCTVY